MSFSDDLRTRLDELSMPVGEFARRLGVTTTRARQILRAEHLREDVYRRACVALYLEPDVRRVPIGERAATYPELTVAPWYAREGAPSAAEPLLPPGPLPPITD